MKTVTIHEATKSYEEWLREHVDIVEADLKFKHDNMDSNLFLFFRGTFYRWAQIFGSICPEEAAAPIVLAAQDVHVENFGTWRDTDGRLIWGINDFDEAAHGPYTTDLIRLASSAYLAIKEGCLAISFEEACNAILEGYGQSLKSGGKPFVLEEEQPEMRKMAMSELRVPVNFWKKMQALKPEKGSVPKEAMKALESLMPASGLKPKFVHRHAGQGSLGRQRFTAIVEYLGGMIARETKPLLPSACLWASGRKSGKIFYSQILENAIRCPDPFFRVHGQWLVRRLAPHCSRIELESLPKVRDEIMLLHAMGWEIANIHLGTEDAAELILPDLRQRNEGKNKWLNAAARVMAKFARDDWKSWKN